MYSPMKQHLKTITMVNFMLQTSACDLYYLFNSKRDRQAEFPSAGLLPKCLQQPKLGQAEARSLNLYVDFPYGQQGPNPLNNYWLHSRGAH